MQPRISIRQRLLLLVLVPTVALAAVSGLQLRDSVKLSADAETISALVSVNEAQLQLLDGLQLERTRTLEAFNLGEGGTAMMTGDDLAGARAEVDRALGVLEQDVDNDVLEAAGSAFVTGLNSTLGSARELVAARADFDTGAVSVEDTRATFGEGIDAVLAFDELFGSVIQHVDTQPLLLATSTFARLKVARLERGDLLLLGVSGDLEPEVVVDQTTLLAAEEATLLDVLAGTLPDATFDRVSEVAAIDPAAERNRVELGLAAENIGDVERIAEENRIAAQRLRTIEAELSADLVGQAETIGARARQRTITLALVTAAAVLSLVLMLLVMNRSISRPLKQLTRLASRLGAGLQTRVEQVSQGGEAPPREFDGPEAMTLLARDDELGELAKALASSSDEVTSVAVLQARTREGFARTISDIARREQGLVERQLTLLDGLEDREENPDQLGELFKLDHLATRMRRNAENLLLLATGKVPGSAGAGPVPIVDVVRTAAAEIEDYARVDVRVGLSDHLAARAATAVSHLLAELIENAARFSPPASRVDVTARKQDDHVVITVLDRGIGMTPEDLAAVRSQLADPPALGTAGSRRLGLYVVALIADQLGITVDLNANDDVQGGIRVDIVVGASLLHEPSGAGGWPDAAVEHLADLDAGRAVPDTPTSSDSPMVPDDAAALAAIDEVLALPASGPSTVGGSGGDLPVRGAATPSPATEADPLPLRKPPADEPAAAEHPEPQALPVRASVPSSEKPAVPPRNTNGDMPVMDPLPSLPPSSLPTRNSSSKPAAERGSGIPLAAASRGATTSSQLTDLGALLAGLNDIDDPPPASG